MIETSSGKENIMCTKNIENKQKLAKLINQCIVEMRKLTFFSLVSFVIV